MVFSRIELRRLSEELTSRYFVVKRETTYQSPVALTPYLSEERIDDQAIGGIVDAAYDAAGLHPDDVDTGAVILTGEALRRENAKSIADVLAEVGGEFVCAAAGHHMESVLAAYGSGAAEGVARSRRQRFSTSTSAAVPRSSRSWTTATSCTRRRSIIGGRLAVIDDDFRLTRLDPAGKRLAALAGCDWSLGDVVTEADLTRVTAWMADALVAALTGGRVPADVESLWLTEPLGTIGGIQGAMFSGGVGEYVYGREEKRFRRSWPAFRTRDSRTTRGGALPVCAPAGR